MAHYEPVNVPPMLAIQDGFISCAATVVARVTQFGKVSLQVATWEAGRGQRVEYIGPAEFESWRRSFVRPSETN